MSGIADYKRYQSYWHERNFGCRIREYVYRGHRLVSLENEILKVVVAADKGTDILEFVYKPFDLDVLWHSYNGLRPFDHYRPSSPLANGHFREHYAGGWHEMLPNGAVPCTHRGATFGQHGEATHLPWAYTITRDEPETVSVRFTVRLIRTPLLVEKTLSLSSGCSTLRIEERIVCEADQDVEILWGHHPAFGWPFLEEGSRVYLPQCEFSVPAELPNSRLAGGQRGAWPCARSVRGEPVDLSVIPGPEAKSQDFIRLDNLADGWFAVVNPRQQLGFALRWDHRMFPVLGFWQLFRGGTDFPWYGTNYVAALEPACDLPSLAEAHARKGALRLGAGDSVQIVLEATAFREPIEVQGVDPGGIVK